MTASLLRMLRAAFTRPQPVRVGDRVVLLDDGGPIPGVVTRLAPLAGVAFVRLDGNDQWGDVWAEPEALRWIACGWPVPEPPARSAVRSGRPAAFVAADHEYGVDENGTAWERHAEGRALTPDDPRVPSQQVHPVLADLQCLAQQVRERA